LDSVGEIPGSLYWKNPFPALASSRQLVEFEVLDVEKLRGKEAKQKGKYVLAEAQICRSDNVGEDNSEIFVTTHLGNILHAGDTVKGYDISTSNFNDKNLRSYKSMKLPDVILVRKIFEKRRKRNWKLKEMEKEEEENGKKKPQTKDEKEYKRFLEELEEDEELRSKINIYKGIIRNKAKLLTFSRQRCWKN
jgi:nonsense-mediated mRNA decay protein 3